MTSADRASHLLNFDHRRRPEALRTAIATAFFLTEEEWIKQTGATVIEGEATMPLRMIFCLPFVDAAPLST
jgi:hypothetical protein